MKGGKWYLQESNRGHTDFQSDALPTELRHHSLSFTKAILSIAGAKVRRKNESAKLLADYFLEKVFFSPFIARFHVLGDSSPVLLAGIPDRRA